MASRDGRKIILGVRAEHILSDGRAARGEAAALQATVELVETLGNEVVVHARAGEDALVFKQQPHRVPEVGARVPVQLELDHLHLFDAETEARLG
jgi:multiple sugar transport system ATP-binding protein